MKKVFSFSSILLGALSILAVSCTKTDQSVNLSKKDYSLGESFDSVSVAVAKGWQIKNNSKPIGTMAWIQSYYYVSLYHGYTPGKTGGPQNYANAGGLTGNTPGYSGADFIMTTSEAGNGVADISNWLISPELMVKNGDRISFYTRTFANPAIGADRLEVRINELNSSADVGREATSVGGFTNVVLDINPDYLLEGDDSYPGEWTQYTATISGLTGNTARKTRIAFRYFVPAGGPLGENSVGIGLDEFIFTSL